MKITATIIVFNEEHNIAEVCESVKWADEIVIVDSNSTDKTLEIASNYTDKIFQREFKGYKDKHEFADSMATGDWIFWIDADERVSPELASSIAEVRNTTDENRSNGYTLGRRTFYLKRWIKHSGWYPDLQMRLYRKSGSYWDGIAPHQTARIDGNIGHVNGDLLHYTKQNLSEHHSVTERYATLAADDLVSRGKTVGALGIFVKTVAAFLRVYLIKRGFLDGVQGLIIAFFTAYGVFLKYSKVWELKNVTR